ncbi:hypothetical protein SO802_013757 [Lithocarpus litseifolius]|uniref:DUF4283 domain-containing protein n=1 Tax=Lithocarpus litseifolius TaxID=425828 RepID=A0AAW2DAL5_9ROSI
MEDLTKDWSHFSLSKRENTDFALPRTQKPKAFVVVAKFLTSRFLVIEAVVRAYKQLWRSQNGFKIRNLGNHIVLFEFDNVQDVERILQNQPCTFDKHPVVLKRYEEGSQVKDLIFDKAWFWVQVHDIPLSFMTRKVAKSLCDIVREVCRSPESTKDDGGNFFRVRVNIDISLPLCRGRIITMENGEISWVCFQYKRLPNMCYWCGCLDHNDKQCKLWIQSKGSLSTEKQQFGSFLRAPPFQRGSRNVFYVPGWFEKETSGEEAGDVAAPGTGEVGCPMGESTVVQPVLVTELGGNTTNSNSFSHVGIAFTLGKDESLGETRVGNSLTPNFLSTKLSEMNPTDSLYLSKLAEIDEGIRKFDSVNWLKGGTSFSEVAHPTVMGKWSQLVRTVGTNQPPTEEGLISGLGKRNQDDSRVPLELPGKRRQVVGSHKYYIDAVINENGSDEWRFTDFYGEPDAAKRNEAWAKLRSLNSNQNTTWLCAGDYNEITRQEEKRGGALRSFNQMQLFRDVIDECGLIDLGFVGPKYTWSKHFESGQSIWERLDRGLATNNWFLLFLGTKIHHLHCFSSDHLPLFINLSGLEIPGRRKVFRFEEMWLSDDRCGKTVEAAWTSTKCPNPSNAILKKVAKCEQDLTWWNNNCFENVRRTLAEKKKLLVAAEVEAMRTGINSYVCLLKAEINVLIDKESRLWSQRSRVLWLSKGDSNTKFFHSKATKRLRKNSILGIRDPTGRWLNQTEDIGQAFIKYYTELFSSSCPASQCGALDKIPQVVTD